MTPADDIARADRAKAFMDEFLAPAIAHVEQDYAEKMISTAASTDPRAREIIERLANGVKAVRVVKSLIERHIMDGAIAQQDMQRSAQLSRMSDHKRSVVGV